MDHSSHTGVTTLDTTGHDRLLFINAILIALVTVIAALVAWRA